MRKWLIGFDIGGTKCAVVYGSYDEQIEIIDKINEKYKGIFTEGDKVLLTSLRDRLLTDKKLKKIIQTTEPKIFTESVFPKIFDDAAQASFMESSETYQSLFADAAKYKAIMNALAQILYRDLK